MKVDCIVTVERPDITSQFYPITLTTPVQNIIIGGLRFFEYTILNTYINYRYPIDIVALVRDYLAFDWIKIYGEFICEKLLDISRVNIEYVNYRDRKNIEKILEKYDYVGIIPANYVPKDVEFMNRIPILKTKDINNITDIYKITLTYNYDSNVVNSIVDIIKMNVEYLEYVCNILKISNFRIVIDSEVSNVELPKRCVLYLCELMRNCKIRDGTVIYRKAIVGCEIKNSIIDVYTHAEHHGYIGDSYIGRFVNLGAGTTFSNVKNTKGYVKYLGHSTDMVKLGPVISDHVKTAIGTLIFSGKCVGSYSHVYGLADCDIPPICIYRDGEIIKMDKDKLLQFLDRWCRKYVDPDGLTYEKNIIDRTYDYLCTLLEKSLSNIFFLYSK